MRFYPSLFIKEVILFGSTLALGIFVSVKYLAFLSTAELLQPSSITIGDLVSLVIILGLVWLLSRLPRFAAGMFWVFLSLIIFSGTQIAALSFVSFPWDIMIALGVLLIFILVRIVIVHDLAIILAVAGMGAMIGLEITPSVAIIACILLSFYDIIAVYKTRHMVRMAEGMIRSGAIFGFIIPASFGSFFARSRETQARIGRDFTILGSGDIGLPIVFVSSLVRQSVSEAVITAAFVLIGLLITHIIFVSQKKRQPMAALPPIATMTILGYVVSLLLKF